MKQILPGDPAAPSRAHEQSPQAVSAVPVSPAIAVKRLIGLLTLASGPDRAIDAQLFAAFGTIDEAHCRDWCRMNGRTDLTRDRYIAAWAPAYTGSIDAAVTLIPPVSDLEMMGGGFGVSTIEDFDLCLEQTKRKGHWWATLGHMSFDAFTACAPTAPIAICLAAAQAHDALDECAEEPRKGSSPARPKPRKRVRGAERVEPDPVGDAPESSSSPGQSAAHRGG